MQGSDRMPCYIYNMTGGERGAELCRTSMSRMLSSQCEMRLTDNKTQAHILRADQLDLLGLGEADQHRDPPSSPVCIAARLAPAQ